MNVPTSTPVALTIQPNPARALRRAFRPFAAPVLATALALTAALVSAPAQASDRSISTTVAAGNATNIRLVLPIGEVEVRGDGGSEIRADLELRCRRRRDDCEDRASRVFLDSTREGERVTLAVRGYPKLMRSESLELRGVIHVPADLRLAIDMRIGELRVVDVHTDVRVDMGVGEVRMNLPAASVHGVKLGSGVGDASLRAPQGRIEAERSLLIGAKLDWRDGTGAANVDVDLGVGEVTVDLD